MASGSEREVIIRVADLKAAYDGQVVLDHINFEVYAGEVLAILGGSGSGKSTLLKHMYILTGRLCANSSAVCQTLSAATQWIFSERSGANGAAMSQRRSKTGLHNISPPFFPLSARVPNSAGITPSRSYLLGEGS